MKKSSVRENFIFNATFQVTKLMVPLVTLPYLTRVLGAEGLGKFSFAYSVAFYFSMFIKLGLQNYGNRTIAYVKDDKNKLDRTFSSIYAMQVLCGMVVSLVYLVYSFTISPIPTLAFIGVLIVFSSIIDVTWFMYGMEEFKVTALRDMATKVITTLLIFILVKRPDQIWIYALIYSAGMFVNQLVVWPVVLKHVELVRPAWQEIKEHIKPNLVLFIPVVAISVYRTMDKIMLGALSSDEELGYYHSCENIVKVPMALIEALGIVMLPRTANMIAIGEDENRISSTFVKTILFSMFFSTSIGFGIMTLAREFVPIFFGAGFDKCVWLFYLVLPSSIFVAFANVIRTQYLIPRKLDKYYIISLVLGALVNLIINLIYIPKYASVGAAIGTLAAEIVVCVVQAACVFKEADIGKNITNSLPFIFAGIVMFVAFHNYNVPIQNAFVALLVKIIISGLLYMAVLGSIVGVKRLLVRKAA